MFFSTKKKSVSLQQWCKLLSQLKYGTKLRQFTFVVICVVAIRWEQKISVCCKFEMESLTKCYYLFLHNPLRVGFVFYFVI